MCTSFRAPGLRERTAQMQYNQCTVYTIGAGATVLYSVYRYILGWVLCSRPLERSRVWKWHLIERQQGASRLLQSRCLHGTRSRRWLATSSLLADKTASRAKSLKSLAQRYDQGYRESAARIMACWSMRSMCGKLLRAPRVGLTTTLCAPYCFDRPQCHHSYPLTRTLLL